jgi:hypothetical protein
LRGHIIEPSIRPESRCLAIANGDFGRGHKQTTNVKWCVQAVFGKKRLAQVECVVAQINSPIVGSKGAIDG